MIVPMQYRMELLLLSIFIASAQAYFVVPWSTKHYGPDGPWQAVQITVGGNDSTIRLEAQDHQAVDVYPGGTFTSLIMNSTACKGYTDNDPTCGAGGFWNPNMDRSADPLYVTFSPGYADSANGIKANNMRAFIRAITIGGKSIWNCTLAVTAQANTTYPDGSVHGLSLGHLSLGMDGQTYQRFTLSDTTLEEYRAFMFAGGLQEQSQVQSYSYGLHIGSARFDYPGSLVFGGFNKGRTIGPTTTIDQSGTIKLLDIGIGVEAGGSPFDFDSKQGLLVGNSTQSAPFTAQPDPLDPYLSLPAQTCKAIADLLPVSFDDKLKYYIWNTNDPKFSRIVNSPAYLNFTFPPAPGDSDNVVIKVPFALLNLTLDRPITDKPTQYFPCLPFTPSSPDDGYRLGRAFLQGAFLGRNFQTKIGWMAQAPGPGQSKNGLGEQHQDIPGTATTITTFPNQDLFKNSWSSYWKQLDKNGQPTPAPSNSADSSGLSTGAKAGIGVGVPIGVIALAAGAFFFFRRNRNKADGQQAVNEAEASEFQYPPGDNTSKPYDHYQFMTPYEDVPQELPDEPLPAQELPGSTSATTR